MMDFLNRQRTYLNSRVLHTPNHKEHALEEANTIELLDIVEFPFQNG